MKFHKKCNLTNNLLCSSGLSITVCYTTLFCFLLLFSLSPSVYYRKVRSETLPTSPPVVETEVQQPSEQPPPPFPSTEELPHPSPSKEQPPHPSSPREQPPHPPPSRIQPSPVNLPHGDGHAMETDELIHDPAAECLDPSMIKDLDFDIPLMFTDDDLGVPVEKPEVVEESELKLELGLCVFSCLSNIQTYIETTTTKK